MKVTVTYKIMGVTYKKQFIGGTKQDALNEFGKYMGEFLVATQLIEVTEG